MPTPSQITRARIIQGFRRWEKDLRENPQNFPSHDECRKRDINELAAANADALIRYMEGKK